MCGMEESLEELYQQFVECRKQKIKELIEVQSQMSVAEEVSHVKRAQNALEQLISETDSGMVASNLAKEIRANANFMMDVMGLGKEQMAMINTNQNQSVLPGQTIDVPKIGMIEDVEFED